MQDQQLAAGLARIQAGFLERDADPPPRGVGIARDVDRAGEIFGFLRRSPQVAL